VKVIILAAGQGSRMGRITETIPKSLLPIGKTNVICRLITQLLNLGIDDVTIVVGYKENLLKEEINKISGQKLKFISNKKFKEDINILSLSLALEGVNKGKFLVLEADCIYDDKAIKLIVDSCKDDKSYWYTMGSFESTQMGGILLSDEDNSVKDIRIVNNFEEKYSLYNKLIGVLKVGNLESPKYLDLLRQYKNNNIKQYYLKPWIDHLSELDCTEVSLKSFRSGAFNDLSEYNKVLQVFKDQVQ